MGELYVVATPIGNLDDITLRAVEVLKRVDLIAAEDTRHSGQLLAHLGIDTPLRSCHEQNEDDIAIKIVERLLDGQSVALISDAGTPLISDPGYRLVCAALARGVRVVPIPGASAVIAALSIAGLPTDRFAFEGFLPAKHSARRTRLEKLKFEPRTLVFYETPHRIEAVVADMAAVLGGERRVTLAREMTKKFEQVWNGRLEDASKSLAGGDIRVRGEFVIVLEGSDEVEEQLDARRLMEELLAEFPPRKAADMASRLTGRRKKALYELALKLKKNS